MALKNEDSRAIPGATVLEGFIHIEYKALGEQWPLSLL